MRSETRNEWTEGSGDAPGRPSGSDVERFTNNSQSASQTDTRSQSRDDSAHRPPPAKVISSSARSGRGQRPSGVRVPDASPPPRLPAIYSQHHPQTTLASAVAAHAPPSARFAALPSDTNTLVYRGQTPEEIDADDDSAIYGAGEDEEEEEWEDEKWEDEEGEYNDEADEEMEESSGSPEDIPAGGARALYRNSEEGRSEERASPAGAAAALVNPFQASQFATVTRPAAVFGAPNAATTAASSAFRRATPKPRTAYSTGYVPVEGESSEEQPKASLSPPRDTAAATTEAAPPPQASTTRSPFGFPAATSVKSAFGAFGSAAVADTPASSRPPFQFSSQASPATGFGVPAALPTTAAAPVAAEPIAAQPIPTPFFTAQTSTATTTATPFKFAASSTPKANSFASAAPPEPIRPAFGTVEQAGLPAFRSSPAPPTVAPPALTATAFAGAAPAATKSAFPISKPFASASPFGSSSSATAAAGAAGSKPSAFAATLNNPSTLQQPASKPFVFGAAALTQSAPSGFGIQKPTFAAPSRTNAPAPAMPTTAKDSFPTSTPFASTASAAERGGAATAAGPKPFGFAAALPNPSPFPTSTTKPFGFGTTAAAQGATSGFAAATSTPFGASTSAAASSSAAPAGKPFAFAARSAAPAPTVTTATAAAAPAFSGFGAPFGSCPSPPSGAGSPFMNAFPTSFGAAAKHAPPVKSFDLDMTSNTKGTAAPAYIKAPDSISAASPEAAGSELATRVTVATVAAAAPLPIAPIFKGVQKMADEEHPHAPASRTFPSMAYNTTPKASALAAAAAAATSETPALQAAPDTSPLTFEVRPGESTSSSPVSPQRPTTAAVVPVSAGDTVTSAMDMMAASGSQRTSSIDYSGMIASPVFIQDDDEEDEEEVVLAGPAEALRGGCLHPEANSREPSTAGVGSTSAGGADATPHSRKQRVSAVGRSKTMEDMLAEWKDTTPAADIATSACEREEEAHRPPSGVSSSATPFSVPSASPLFVAVSTTQCALIASPQQPAEVQLQALAEEKKKPAAAPLALTQSAPVTVVPPVTLKVTVTHTYNYSQAEAMELLSQPHRPSTASRLRVTDGAAASPQPTLRVSLYCRPLLVQLPNPPLRTSLLCAAGKHPALLWAAATLHFLLVQLIPAVLRVVAMLLLVLAALVACLLVADGLWSEWPMLHVWSGQLRDLLASLPAVDVSDALLELKKKALD